MHLPSCVLDKKYRTLLCKHCRDIRPGDKKNDKWCSKWKKHVHPADCACPQIHEKVKK